MDEFCFESALPHYCPLIHSQFESSTYPTVPDEASKCFCNSLLKIFIKNNASLNKLYITEFK